MAYNVTDSGIEISRGRGKAKVTIEVSFAQLERWAKRQKIDTPKLLKKTFGYAVSGLKGRFAKIMREGGGVEGFPKFKDFEAFTKELRALNNDSRPMGGVLSDRKHIVAYKRNGWQVIGWPDALAKWSAKFQEGLSDAVSEAMFVDPQSRARLHRRGIKDVPRAYVHNPRMVFPEPFGAVVRESLDKWARGAFYKELAKQMVKAGGINE